MIETIKDYWEDIVDMSLLTLASSLTVFVLLPLGLELIKY